MQEEGQPGRRGTTHCDAQPLRARANERVYFATMEFQIEAAQLINEGGVHCVPVVFARPLQGGHPVELGPRSYLNDMPVLRLDAALAAERGPGVVAFVLEDAMDARWFQPGDTVRLESR